jgi:N-acyl homoserine lactone hydrolase
MDSETTLRARAEEGSFAVGSFAIDILVQGFPGKTVCHGGLGWSTVALVRGQGRVILIDAGNFGMRRLITTRLAAHGLALTDVTDVILTHAHYDHSINWPMFSAARVLIGKQELDWAVAQPLGHHTIPEFYVRELAVSKQLHGVEIAEQVIHGLTPTPDRDTRRAIWSMCSTAASAT